MIPTVVHEPGGRRPAPERLRVVQLYVNSVDLEDDTDHFADLPASQAWLRDLGLTVDGFDDDARRAAIRLREGLRDLIDERDDPTLPHTSDFSKAVDALDLRVRVHDGIPTLVGTTPAGRALAPIVDAVRTTIDDGTWLRLKVCERDTCRWVFYDHSKNHASRWCASSVCGSREKARRAYARRNHRS